jgi:hypothetical protein
MGIIGTAEAVPFQSTDLRRDSKEELLQAGVFDARLLEDGHVRVRVFP